MKHDACRKLDGVAPPPAAHDDRILDIVFERDTVGDPWNGSGNVRDWALGRFGRSRRASIHWGQPHEEPQAEEPL